MKSTMSLNGVWKVHWSETDSYRSDGEWIQATVPGDFTTDLSVAGILPEDIYYRENLKQAKWIEDVYIWYEREFSLEEDQVSCEIELVCDGIDLTSRIYVNSVRVGGTAGAFQQYRIPITEAVHTGMNKLTVCVQPARSHIARMREAYPDYWALFTPGRNLVRHPQCQFGWDWAPDALSLGIWRDIYLSISDGNRISDLFVETGEAGECILRCELNYKQEALLALEKGVPQASFPIYYPEGSLRFEIQFEGESIAQAERSIDGVNVFCGMRVEQPLLWWPNGMGSQNLYTARVSLISPDGSVADSMSTTFAFRTVRIEEPVIEADRVGFCFMVNDQRVYARGANWVPLDCFPGRIEEDRYERILKKAREGNINMLRIWGGGVYEHRRFYELCDTYGIMVWQDFMNACSEIPDDQQSLLDTLITEAEYQVKRLRNHPSVVCWCGGNESSSSHMYEPDKPGRRIVQYYYRGIVGALSPHTPYIPGSSHSKSDFGQSHTSGETHWSMWPRTKETRYGTYRERLEGTRTVFNGEVSLQGPSPLKSLKRFLEPEDMWPPGDVYDFHAMNHPAMPDVHPRWVTSQLKATEQIAGSCDSIDSFVAKGMMMHALMVSEELLYYRSMRPANSGALLWMYNEPWPCMNWALVDYYGNLKAAYWAMKRAFSPVTCYIRSTEGTLRAHIMTDPVIDHPVTLRIWEVELPSRIIAEREISVSVDDRVGYSTTIDLDDLPDTHILFAQVSDGRFSSSYVYHQELSKDIPWPEPEYSWQISKRSVLPSGEHQVEVSIDALSYCRFLYLQIEGLEDDRYTVSDSCFDMVPGSLRVITVTSEAPVDTLTVSSLVSDGSSHG